MILPPLPQQPWGRVECRIGRAGAAGSGRWVCPGCTLVEKDLGSSWGSRGVWLGLCQWSSYSVSRSAINLSRYMGCLCAKKTTHRQRHNKPQALVDLDIQCHKPLTSFYAIRGGLQGYCGVVLTWEECKNLTQGVPNALHQKFNSLIAAEAFAAGQSPHAAQGSDWRGRLYEVRLGQETRIVRGWSSASAWRQDPRFVSLRRVGRHAQ